MSKQAAEIFNKCAQGYEEKFMDLALYNDTFETFTQHLPKNSRVLEVGSGPWNITQRIVSSRPDLNILGTDLSKRMVFLAQKNNPSAQFQVMDGRDVGKISGKYQGIIAGFLFPYFSEEECIRFLQDSHTKLEKDGVIYISMMAWDNNRKSQMQVNSFGDKIYVYYHTEEILLKIFEKNHYHVLYTSYKSYTENDGSSTQDFIVIAQKR